MEEGIPVVDFGTLVDFSYHSIIGLYLGGETIDHYRRLIGSGFQYGT